MGNLGTRGMKDRRAVTAQRVSVYRCEADRVKQLNSRLRGIRLSDFSYEHKPCVLGDLWGNRFDIALRFFFENYFLCCFFSQFWFLFLFLVNLFLRAWLF